MLETWRRLVVTAVCSLLALGGAFAVAAPAQARPDSSSAVSTSAGSDDYTSGGQSSGHSSGGTLAAPEVGVQTATDGTVSSVSGKATVHGTVTCTSAARVDVELALHQVVKNQVVRGSGLALVDCVPGGPVAWTAALWPVGTVPFKQGYAEASVFAWTVDPDTGFQIGTRETAIVYLRKN